MSQPSLSDEYATRYPHLDLPGPEMMADLITGAFRGQLNSLRLGRRQELVVLAADGISWELLEQICTNADALLPMRSTFPSTSLVSWLAAIGLAPGTHPVPGPVLSIRPNLTSNLIADKDVAWSGPDSASPQLPANEIPKTAFETLADLGLHSEVLVGDFYGISESWISLLTRGAIRHNPSVPLAPIRLAPLDLQAAAIHDLRMRQRHSQAAVRWVYINFDDRIHRTGYDGDVVKALVGLAQAAETLAEAGYTVLLHSDHGHIRNRSVASDETVWASVDDPVVCAAPAGGAGRVRWLYPRAGTAQPVANRLREELGTEIGVFLRDSPEWQDFIEIWGNPGLAASAVGEVIAVALTDRFPVPDPAYLYEHGSICADEMRTGAAIWNGR